MSQPYIAAAEASAKVQLLERYDSGFRHSGGARGVYEHCHIRELHTPALLVRGTNRTPGLDDALSGVVEDDDFTGGVFGLECGSSGSASGAFEDVADLAVDEDEARGGRFDAVDETVAGEVVVEHCGFSADGPEAEPEPDEGGLVHEV